MHVQISQRPLTSHRRSFLPVIFPVLWLWQMHRYPRTSDWFNLMTPPVLTGALRLSIHWCNEQPYWCSYFHPWFIGGRVRRRSLSEGEMIQYCYQLTKKKLIVIWFKSDKKKNNSDKHLFLGVFIGFLFMGFALVVLYYAGAWPTA